MELTLMTFGLIALSVAAQSLQAGDAVPPELRRWLVPQDWVRDTDGPIVSLGEPGTFDDAHMFAPCVAHENGRFMLWYSGSPGSVSKRVFSLGLATSNDGRRFEKHQQNPVLRFEDGKHSVLTAQLLRNADGSVLREGGELRLWFSSTYFAGRGRPNTLHEATSVYGIHWSAPSPPQLKYVYAPTVIKEGDTYRMWYVDVRRSPWSIGYADSRDGRAWKPRKGAVLELGQEWERKILVYPTVVKVDGVYLMWYGSYWAARPNTTAIGLAVSLDGIKWHKNPHNPMFKPDPSRPWESHYTTSQSVLRLPDGSWRIWYASRKKPPFVNKYFAIGTARWEGLRSEQDHR